MAIGNATYTPNLKISTFGPPIAESHCDLIGLFYSMSDKATVSPQARGFVDTLQVRPLP